MATDKQHTTLNVPTLRFPEFSGEWKECRLSELLEFKNGLNPDAKKFGSGIKFISVMDILNNTFITHSNIRATVLATPKEQKEFSVNFGDILFQRSSETLEDVGQANVYIDSKPAVFGGFVIRGRKIGDYNPMFFRYLLSTPTARKKIIVKGAGAQHFNIGQDGLSKVHLNFPSLEEQEKIANTLFLIDERITTQKKVIEKLQSLIGGIYKSIFADIDCSFRLDEICEIRKGQQVNGTELFEDGEYYVMNGGVEPSGCYDKFNTPANTISISEGGNSCGYVQFNNRPFWSGGHCYTLRNVNLQYNLRFLYHYLKANESEIMKLRIGSGLPNIQKKDLEAYCIPMISFIDQVRISKSLDAVQTKIEQSKDMLALYEKQKRYLLSTIFI
jgi:type I restriction enzyme S subunit